MSRESRFVRRRTGLAPLGGTADYHYRNETAYYRDIEKARDMDRNDAIVGQTIDRAVSNIIQDGFTLDVKTGDTGVDEALKDYWLDWAGSPDSCDIAGEMAFNDFERHVMRSTLVDGDNATIGTRNGSLQFFEGHTIQSSGRSNNIVLGVELDAYRKRLRYHFKTDSITPNGIKTSIEEPRSVRDENGIRTLFHMYNAKRVTQTRGVTALAPVFALCGMFEDINFAKLVQQQIVSCFAIFREQTAIGSDGSPPSTAGDEFGDVSFEATESGARTIKGIAPGMEFIGNPGEKLQGFSPNVPNAEFFDHVKLMLRLISVNLGLPLNVMLMDSSESSYTGHRGAKLEAVKGWKHNQNQLKLRFHKPITLWKFRQFIDSDPALRRAEAKLGKRIFSHHWNTPSWESVDPIKDAQADALELQNALTSPRRLHGRKGQDWGEVASEMVEDYAMAIILAKRQAMEINQTIQDEQPVHWRELLPIVMPNGLKMDLQDPQKLAIEQEKANA